MFNTRSKTFLKNLHPKLVEVLTIAQKTTPISFQIIGGKRTLEEQKILVAAGKSKTMTSRHLTGKAADFVAVVNGKISWDVKYYKVLITHFKKIAKSLKIPVTLGGDWVSFRDWDHIELDQKVYGK